MQLYDELKKAAAESEAAAVDVRIKVDQLRLRRQQLEEDLSKEQLTLDAAEQEAAMLRSQQAEARAEGRALATAKKMPDVGTLRETVRTTKDAVSLVTRQLDEIQPVVDRVEAAAREAREQQARFETGAFILELAPLIAEILRRAPDCSKLIRALGEVSKAKSPENAKEHLVRYGTDIVFGYDSCEGWNSHLITNAIALDPQILGVLPAFGSPSATVLDAIAIDGLSEPHNGGDIMMETPPRKARNETLVGTPHGSKWQRAG